MDGTLLDGAPIVRTLHGIFRAGGSIRDRFLYKKTLVYLKSYASGSLNVEEKRKYKAKLDNANFAEAEVERVVAILDSVTEMSQASWLGKCHRRLADEEITLDDFHELSEVIRRMFVGDAPVVQGVALGTIRSLDDAERYRLNRLEANGLLAFRLEPTWDNLEAGMRHGEVELTELGRLFAESCLNVPRAQEAI